MQVVRLSLIVLILLMSLSSPRIVPQSRAAQGVSGCTHDGLRWMRGAEQPDVARRAQERLAHHAIAADVTARAYGEGDSCDTFHEMGVDLTITLHAPPASVFLDSPHLTATIADVLGSLGGPPLGTVRLRFPSGESTSVRLHPRPRPLVVPAAATWQQRTPSSHPSARYTHGMVYDSQRHVTVLFGGDDTGAARLNDTWEYTGNTWVQRTPTSAPPGRANIAQALTYDTLRQKVVLFGGLGSAGYLDDTWEYNGTQWTPNTTTPRPNGRDAHAMSFDSTRHVSVLFGGYGGGAFNDTWEYSGGWQRRFPTASPPARFHHRMAFDPRRNVLVLFGGTSSSNTYLADTWEYDGTTWRHVVPAQSPSGRENHSMTYDSDRGVVLLFGGRSTSGPLNDTWEYDGVTWRQVVPTQAPSVRTEMGLVYDQQRHEGVLFGGGYWSQSGGLTISAQTWAYRASPPPEASISKKVYVLVYDPVLSTGQRLSAHLGWSSHTDLTAGTIAFFQEASGGLVQYSVAMTTVVNGWPEKEDGFRYTEASYLDVIERGAPAHQPDAVNYAAIINTPAFDICGKANRGEIDEVWIYNGPAFGFYESTLVGPNAYWYNSPPVSGVTACTRLVPIMGPSQERGLAEALHNFGHRTESAMKMVYGSWVQNRTAHDWERFALVDALAPNYTYSGCGDTHFPPNGTSHYDYANAGTTLSTCADFDTYPNLGDPSTTAKPVTCATWGCHQVGYLGYWFDHLPSTTGCSPGRIAHNWWTYILVPESALVPAKACHQGAIFLPRLMR